MAFAFDSQGAQVIVNDPFIDHDEARRHPMELPATIHLRPLV